MRVDRVLLDMLRRGGYILYARHAEATAGEDRPDLNFMDCEMVAQNRSVRSRTGRLHFFCLFICTVDGCLTCFYSAIR